jgi:hypothetical protein
MGCGCDICEWRRLSLNYCDKSKYLIQDCERKRIARTRSLDSAAATWSGAAIHVDLSVLDNSVARLIDQSAAERVRNRVGWHSALLVVHLTECSRSDCEVSS